MSRAEYIAGLQLLLRTLDRQGASRERKLWAIRDYKREAGR